MNKLPTIEPISKRFKIGLDYFFAITPLEHQNTTLLKFAKFLDNWNKVIESPCGFPVKPRLDLLCPPQYSCFTNGKCYSHCIIYILTGEPDCDGIGVREWTREAGTYFNRNICKHEYYAIGENGEGKKEAENIRVNISTIYASILIKQNEILKKEA